MLKRARKPLRDERGMSLVFVGIGLAAFVAATMLAIDVGMLMTARTQAQNSADAGAHAGAVALAFDDYADRSPNGPAVTSALRQARANQVMDASVDVQPEDVVFLNDPTGEPNQVQVTVYRSAARGNPFGLFIAPVFGIDTASVSATATAEASPADVPPRCLPFTIPDKWDERTNPPFNADTSYYDLYSGRNGNNPGVPLANPDVYVPPTEYPNNTGYRRDRDIGTVIKLKTDPATTVSPSVYNPIVVPGEGTGADNYRNGIVNGICPALNGWGAQLTLEPGNMVGPTQQGIDELVAKDPDARWINGCTPSGRITDCLQGSAYNPIYDSPRIASIPLYDPDYYERNQQTGRNVAFHYVNWLSVFVIGMRGGEVMAVIVPGAGGRSGNTNMPKGMFLKTVRIIQ